MRIACDEVYFGWIECATRVEADYAVNGCADAANPFASRVQQRVERGAGELVTSQSQRECQGRGLQRHANLLLTCTVQNDCGPLALAAHWGHALNVEELIRAGAEIDAPDTVHFLQHPPASALLVASPTQCSVVGSS